MVTFINNKQNDNQNGTILFLGNNLQLNSTFHTKALYRLVTTYACTSFDFNWITLNMQN